MALRHLDSVRYLPILSLRPGEMRGLQELPDSTKDAILPIVHMRPWVGSHTLDRSIERLAEAYGDRPVVVSIDDATETLGTRPVHVDLELLRQPTRGYLNWCEFVAGNELYIPCVQLLAPNETDEQITFFHELGRGMTVIVRRDGFGALRQLARRVSLLTEEGRNVCFLVDYGVAHRDHQLIAATVVGQYATIMEECPRAHFSVSASSFPHSFTDIVDQPIYERLLFDNVLGEVGPRKLIYSDRGSARVERSSGGGGQPIPPRIDYPRDTDWRFYRSDDDFEFSGYRQQARTLMATPAVWDGSLRVWGTLMIERTANGDTSAITSQQRSAAVRINLHLQRQTFYGDEEDLYETDDDWDL
jgi:hypothetical protein